MRLAFFFEAKHREERRPEQILLAALAANKICGALFGSMEGGLRGAWRKDLGCFVVLGDYEESPLKDLRGAWRKDLGALLC